MVCVSAFYLVCATMPVRWYEWTEMGARKFGVTTGGTSVWGFEFQKG